MASDGAPLVGTVEESQLWRFPAAAQAVFWTLVVPAGSGSSRTTANERAAEAPPPARVPRRSVQVEAAVEEAGTKVVLAGTVSAIEDERAVAWPRFVRARP